MRRGFQIIMILFGRDKLGQCFFFNNECNVDAQIWNGTEFIQNTSETADFEYDLGKLPKRTAPIIPTWVTNDVAWFLGFFFLYGNAYHHRYYVKRKHRIIIEFPDIKPLWRCKRVLKTWGIKEIVINSIPILNIYRLTASGTESKSVVMNLLNLFYYAGVWKKIPKLMLNTEKDIALQFFSAFPKHSVTIRTTDTLMNMRYIHSRILNKSMHVQESRDGFIINCN